MEKVSIPTSEKSHHDDKMQTDLPPARLHRAERQFFDYDPYAAIKLAGCSVVERCIDTRAVLLKDFYTIGKKWRVSTISPRNSKASTILDNRRVLYPGPNQFQRSFFPAYTRLIDTIYSDMTAQNEKGKLSADVVDRFCGVLYSLGIVIHPYPDANGQTFRSVALTYLKEFDDTVRDMFLPLTKEDLKKKGRLHKLLHHFHEKDSITNQINTAIDSLEDSGYITQLIQLSKNTPTIPFDTPWHDLSTERRAELLAAIQPIIQSKNPIITSISDKIGTSDAIAFIGALTDFKMEKIEGLVDSIMQGSAHTSELIYKLVFDRLIELDSPNSLEPNFISDVLTKLLDDDFAGDLRLYISQGIKPPIMDSKLDSIFNTFDKIGTYIRNNLRTREEYIREGLSRLYELKIEQLRFKNNGKMSLSSWLQAYKYKADLLLRLNSRSSVFVSSLDNLVKGIKADKRLSEDQIRTYIEEIEFIKGTLESIPTENNVDIDSPDEPPDPPHPPKGPPGNPAGGGEVQVRETEIDDQSPVASLVVAMQPASASPARAVNTHPVYGNAQAATARAPERRRRSIRDNLNNTQIAFIESLARQERDTFLSHINGIIATQPGTTLPQAIQQVMDTYTAIDGFADMVGASTRLCDTQLNVAFQKLPAYLQNRVNGLSENKQLGRMFGKNLLPFLVQTAQYIADSCPIINSDGETHSIDDGSFMNWILIGLINSDNQYALQDAQRNIHHWTEESLEQLKNGDGEAFVQLVQFLDNLSNSSVNASIFASGINNRITDYIHRNITIPEQKEKERQEMQAKAEQIIAYAVEVGAITGDIATYILGTSWSIGAPLVGWVLIKTAKLLGCTLEVAIGASTRAGGKAVDTAVGYVSNKSYEPKAKKLIDQANRVQEALEQEAVNGKTRRREEPGQKCKVPTIAESKAHRAQEELQRAMKRGEIPPTHMEEALRALATHTEAQQVIQAHRTAHTVRSGRNVSNLGRALAQNRKNMSEATFFPRTGKNSPGVEPVTQRIYPYLSAITRNGKPEFIGVPDLTNYGVEKLVQERHDLAARRNFFQFLKNGIQWHFGTRDGTKEEKLKRIDRLLTNLHERSIEHNARYDIYHQTIDNVAHVLGLGEKNVSPAQVDKNVTVLIDKFSALDRIQHSIQQLEQRINQTQDVLSNDHTRKYTRALQKLIAAEKKLLETGVHADGENKILAHIIQHAGKASEIGLLLAEKLQQPVVTPEREMTADAVTGTVQGEEDTGTEVSCGSTSADEGTVQEVSTPTTTIDDRGMDTDTVTSDTPGTRQDNLILPEHHKTAGPTTRPTTLLPHTGEDSTPGATAVSAKSLGPDPMMPPQVPPSPAAQKNRWTRVETLRTKKTKYPVLNLAHSVAQGAATTARRGGATALGIAASGAGAGVQLLGGGLHLAGSAPHKIHNKVDMDRKQIADAMRNASRREEQRLSQSLNMLPNM